MRKAILCFLFICLILWIPSRKDFFAATTPSWHVGVILGYTGVEADSAKMVSNGIELAAKVINENGGIHGKKINLFHYDNRQDLEKTLFIMNQALDDNLIAILGPQLSTTALAAGKIAEAKKIPLISPYATHVDVTKNKKYVFRACFDDAVQGKGLAQFAVSDLNAKNIAVITNASNDYSVGLSDIFMKNVKGKGGTVVAHEYYLSEQTDFRNQLRKILLAKPALLFIPGYNFDSALIIQQSLAMGYKGIFLGGDGWGGTNTFRKLIGVLPEKHSGIYAATHWHKNLRTSKNRNFVRLYESHFGQKPITDSALGYDAAMMLFYSMQQSSRIDPRTIQQYLERLKDFNGVTGHITTKGTSGLMMKDIVIVKWNANDFKLHKIVTPAL